MKKIDIGISKAEVLEQMRTEAANYAARAELMGVEGVFDVMAVMDEETGMVMDWMRHSLDDLRVLMARWVVRFEEVPAGEQPEAAAGEAQPRTAENRGEGEPEVAEDWGGVRIELGMPNNYPDGMDKVLKGRCEQVIVTELLVHWFRQCEAGATMKGVESPLGRQIAKVRDAAFMQLKEALKIRNRMRLQNEQEEVNDITDKVWITDETGE